MRQARIRPHFRNGQPDGITLTRIRPNSIFRRLGLRNGDIITGVDGQAIQTADDALGFYNSLKSSSNVTIQIRRRGRTKNIEYDIM
jgi:general secretion pathway protein C